MHCASLRGLSFNIYRVTQIFFVYELVCNLCNLCNDRYYIITPKYLLEIHFLLYYIRRIITNDSGKLHHKMRKCNVCNF